MGKAADLLQQSVLSWELIRIIEEYLVSSLQIDISRMYIGNCTAETWENSNPFSFRVNV